MKLAALDLGSNSFLCLICHLDAHNQLVLEKDLLSVVRLGQGLGVSGKFLPEALQRADNALAGFAREIQSSGCDHVLAFATAAARDATNQQEFFQICHQHKIPVEVISGRQEAEITYQGAVCEIIGTPKLKINKDHFQLVIDIGGRSTELVLGSQGKVIFAKSLSIGCVGLMEQYASSGQDNVNAQEEMRKAISDMIEPVLQDIFDQARSQDLEFIAVAGTPTTLASMELGHYSAESIEGYVLNDENLTKWSSILARLSPAEICARYHIDPKRADVMMSGVEILNQTNQCLMRLTKKKTCIIVSTKGIRYGLMMEMVRRFGQEP